MRSEGLELVGGSLEVHAGLVGHLVSDHLVEADLGVETSADGGTTLGEHLEGVHGGLDPSDAVGQLLDVAAELLAESQRSGVLQMGSADLDNVLVLLGLGLERVSQLGDVWDQVVLDLGHRGDVHHGGEGVVGGLRLVDVVVWVDALGADLPAQQLDGPVRDDLVGVHVGLGTGAGLEDDQWEVSCQLARNDLVSSLLNGLGDLWVQSTELLVDDRGRLLQDTEGPDDWLGHLLALAADLEVLVRSLGLGTPVLVGWDLDLAEGVGLNSDLSWVDASDGGHGSVRGLVSSGNSRSVL